MPYRPLLIPMPTPAFFVHRIPVYGDLILAPMDGYSDQPFRSLCRALGSAMSYTEFINALDVIHGHPQLAQKLAYLPEERPVVFQIFDNEPERLLEAALRLQEYQPDIIDVNLGCSVRSVSGRGAGAGLLREPEKVARIFNILSHALEIPVTAKMRLGWDDNSRNYQVVARAIYENGGKLIAIHGRTRAQGYDGQADWDAIAQVKQDSPVPIIANGDVRSVTDIERIKAHTGCDGVMIGRAAVGNPWIFARLEREHIPPATLHATMRQHLHAMMAYYGVEQGLRRFRKHAARYLSSLDLPPEIRRSFLTASQPQEFWQTLESLSH